MCERWRKNASVRELEFTDLLLVLSLLLKGALLVLMITSNTVGCTFFVKALHGSGSSLPVTVASAATNYVCSALVGFVVFGESTSLAWWCGTSLVLLGLVLTCYVPDEKGTSAVEKKLKQQ
ncbi:PREDICTED: transmembrane protein 42 isoform X2 [Dinoponera quadriceps]|uniref:Transmembrane protein 42 isoform X2 n=1 Tax=Dinoponera quadriceps TaxID=609295 RepID=A0A6P3XN19_DINQU|nr:PREDICTED: transmembrane protein 42 isoform X2 [Dinoponera quadriceps]